MSEPDCSRPLCQSVCVVGGRFMLSVCLPHSGRTAVACIVFGVPIERFSDSASIVVIGRFNPSIFHPAWFQLQGLLGEAEEKTASDRPIVLEDNFSQFELDWLQLRVTPQAFTASTPQESYVGSLATLVTETLVLVRHTPTHMCGLNRDVIYRITPEEQRDQLGWALVPPTNWPLEAPGTASVTEQGRRPDDYEGYIRVTVEPILGVGRGRVIIRINDHYQFGAQPESVNTPKIRDLIVAEWMRSLERSASIAEKMTKVR